ncbi:Initiator Replication protein [Octadecabacter ascidiaceicola]|uniref:Initiator Replication protein n=2 Tax=Octadecabacter ascidiaceicola TaxID=1655543 RepID=A0A238KRZ6_9RHOB|nr:Initiator Replication protein [Octadecabacter ascidiaceicola]
MAALQLQRYLERNTIKHPTALLHYERRLSDFEQGILFLCVHIIAKMERAPDGFYYLEKSLVRAVMRQEGNQDYTRITEAVKTISKTDLRFNFMGQDRTFDSYEAPLIIGRATNKGRGVIAFEVHPRIEKLVKDPRVFARLNIYFISALADVRRGYSFYALFRDLVDRTKSTEVTLDYLELRSYLGVEPSAYPAFKAFKQWVLKPLLDSVNERTDLQLSYEPVKTGRKLTHLKFTIKPQAWQLQLFEAEHAERMVTELAKSFDGALIENKKEPAQIEAGASGERAGLIDKCVKLGVTSKTVERALKAYGVQGVGEIIAHTESRFRKMDAKGEKYDAKNYLAKMLNEGVGVKAAAERQKAEKAAQALAKREAARLELSKAEQAAEALEAEFKDHQRKRATELIETQSAANMVELSAVVGDLIPPLPDYRNRWRSIEGEIKKLDRRKITDRTIFNGYVVPEALRLWGKPEDLNLATYKKSKLIKA